MGRIEGDKPQEVRVAENNNVNGNQNGNNQQATNNNGNGNNNAVAPSGTTENLRTQGDYTRYQLEARYTTNTTVAANGGDPGKTPKSEEALKTVRNSLDESGWFNDVTHDDLKKIDETLRGLNKDELNHVLGQMTTDEFKKWGGELNSGGWFGTGGFDENQQNGLFNHLAQNASADNLVKMFEGLGTNVDSVMSLMDSVAQSAPPAVRDAFIQKVSNHPNMEAVRNEMLLDLGQMGLDIAGIFDPTGAVDGANAVGYLLRGKIGDAIMTGAGIVPLLGDLAKAGKLGKFAARLANIIELAKHSPQFAKAAETALKAIDDVLKKIPLDSVPKPIRDFVESTRKKIDDFFASRTPGGAPPTPPTPPKPPRVDTPGGLDKNAIDGLKNNSDVPAHYRTDEARFNQLAADPDQGGKILPKTRAEAMAGLEAEAQGLLKGPIERGPKGIEFYDKDGIPYDVKTPPSPPPGARWTFNVEQNGKAILDELSAKGTPPGTFPNRDTNAPEARRVILNSTYMNEADHKALWDWLNKNLTPEQLDRIVEIKTRP